MPSLLVEKTFEALFALEDLREILRRTAPHHRLSDRQKEEAKRLILKVREALTALEGALK